MDGGREKIEECECGTKDDEKKKKKKKKNLSFLSTSLSSPPYRPLFYHNLNEMPTPHARALVKKALLGWLALGVVVLWNFVAMSALQYAPYTLVDKDGNVKYEDSGFATAWVVALLLVLLLPVVVFGIYMCLYTAARKKSSLYYCCFFPLYGALVLYFLLQAIGVPTGGGGLMQLIVIAPDAGRDTVAKVFIGISMVCWLVAFAYGVWIAFGVRDEYRGAGGLAAAGKEATKVGAQAAYDNRETIKEAAWEHRDAIKQVAIDNKDVLIQAAKDNKQLAADIAVSAARENPDLAWQTALAVASSSQASPAQPTASASQFTSSSGQPLGAASSSAARPAGAAAASGTDDVIDWSKF
jgi:hypothetical protein